MIEPNTETPLTETPQPVPSAETIKRMGEDLAFIKDQYGIDLDLGGFTEEDKQSIHQCDELRENQKPIVARTLREEVSKYPSSYIQNCNTTTIKAFRNMHTDDGRGGDTTALGLASMDSTRIYVSLREGTMTLRRAVHHELFHKSDFSFIEGKLGIVKTAVLFCTWGGLNQKGFRGYARNRYYNMSESQKNLLSGVGFADKYGLFNEWEDRATTAEILMADPQAAKQKADKDPVFNKKLGRIIWYLQQRSGSLMDKQYFRDLLHEGVEEDYWANKSAA